MQYAARNLAAWTPAGRFRGRLHALLAALLCLLCGLGASAAAADRIAVARAALTPVVEAGERGVALDADFDFELPFALEDAVNRGIALYFVVDFELYRERWYWFDRKLADRSLTYRLTYSALTRQYRLARGSLALPFDTLGEALAVLRRLRGWKVLDAGTLKPDDDYHAQLRMRLDTGQLPKPFQINALTNRDWTLASDWHEVGVAADLAH